MQENIGRFIGIPYEFAKWSYESADCVGLVRLFYSENHWYPDCDDGSFTKDWYVKEPLRLVRYLMKHWNKTRNIEELHYGDAVYFLINGEGHVGIYLEYGKILTTFPPGCKQWDGSILPSTSMILHRCLWEQGFTAGFKRKE